MNMGTAPSKSVGKKEKDENRNRLPLFFKITPKHEVKTEDSDAPTVLRVCLIGLSTSLPEWPDFASNFAPDKDGWYKMMPSSKSFDIPADKESEMVKWLLKAGVWTAEEAKDEPWASS